MSYRELAPPEGLAPHVACLWVRTGAWGRVLPDGCVDVVWTGDDLIVAGPATRPMLPRLDAAEPKLGVRFRIGSAGLALGMRAGELLDGMPRLAEVWPDGDELAERVADAPGIEARLRLMTEAVGSRLADAPAPDRLVRAAVVDLAAPRRRISRLSGRLGISERQLRRRFEGAVGYSPRTLARVLRLQRFLALAEADGRDLARLAADAGYADQPHLTRDCTELGGLPPAALLAGGAGPAGERLRAA